MRESRYAKKHHDIDSLRSNIGRNASRIEGNLMNNKDSGEHEHFWGTPAVEFDIHPLNGKRYRVVGDCACGERLLETDF